MNPQTTDKPHESQVAKKWTALKNVLKISSIETQEVTDALKTAAKAEYDAKVLNEKYKHETEFHQLWEHSVNPFCGSKTRLAHDLVRLALMAVGTPHEARVDKIKPVDPQANWTDVANQLRASVCDPSLTPKACADAANAAVTTCQQFSDIVTPILNAVAKEKSPHGTKVYQIPVDVGHMTITKLVETYIDTATFIPFRDNKPFYPVCEGSYMQSVEQTLTVMKDPVKQKRKSPCANTNTKKRTAK